MHIRSSMKNKYTRLKIIIGVILIVLVITNPSLKDFKEYKGISPIVSENNIVRRSHNFILFSTYQEADNIGEFYHSISYIGVFDNFFESPF